MLRRVRHAVIVLGAAVPIAWAAAGPGPRLVFCAPYYPGSTIEAQPVMDAFASAVAPGKLRAAYFETEEAGIEALRAEDTAFAVVSFPFFVAHRRELRLTPVLQAVPLGGEPTETWTLVAGKGRVSKPSDLERWEISGPAAYASEFVRDHVVAGWGSLPPSVLWRPTAAVLSALRRAASGEDVAVVLDGAGSAGMASLPFAGDLATITRSTPVPVAVFCTVAGRATEAEMRALTRALQSLHERDDGATALEGLRLARFVPAAVPVPAPAPPTRR